MDKALIISYFSPPCNLTSANRIGSWINYLPENKVYPILLTRKWTGKELTEHERLESTTGSLEVEKTAFSEIHALPYIASSRDKFFVKGQSSFLFSLLSKFMTLVGLIGQNFWVQFIPYNNIYFEAKKVLQQDPTIKTLLISGNPFEQFLFGYLLKKEFPSLNWIADYRDEWTSHYLYNSIGSKNFLIKALERYSERKWLREANRIQTVCPYFAKRLEKLHNRKVHIVPNGFDTKIVAENTVVIKEEEPLTLLYTGTLYPNQEVKLFLKSLTSFSKEELRIHFVGASIKGNKKLVKKLLDSGVLKIDGWVDKAEAYKLQLNADGFLMFPFSNMKGWPSSKLFDYLPFKKPVLLCPTDGDIIEDILLDTGLGFVLNSEEAIVANLKEFIALKREKNTLLKGSKPVNIEKYSRNSITKAFAKEILAERA